MTTAKEYSRIHKWLKDEFGRAKTCELTPCKSVEKYGEMPGRFHWGLRAGKEYAEERENFIQLCPLCHRHYNVEYGLTGKYEKERRLTLSLPPDSWAFLKERANYEDKTEEDVVKDAIKHYKTALRKIIEQA